MDGTTAQCPCHLEQAFTVPSFYLSTDEPTLAGLLPMHGSVTSESSWTPLHFSFQLQSERKYHPPHLPHRAMELPGVPSHYLAQLMTLGGRGQEKNAFFVFIVWQFQLFQKSELISNSKESHNTWPTKLRLYFLRHSSQNWEL